MKILPRFHGEAEAIARIISLRFGAIASLTEKAPEDVTRVIGEAIQSAYHEGRAMMYVLWDKS